MWFRFATVKVGELDNKNDDIDAICKKDLETDSWPQSLEHMLCDLNNRSYS
jgi:hypothetical protein